MGYESNTLSEIGKYLYNFPLVEPYMRISPHTAPAVTLNISPLYMQVSSFLSASVKNRRLLFALSSTLKEVLIFTNKSNTFKAYQVKYQTLFSIFRRKL